MTRIVSRSLLILASCCLLPGCGPGVPSDRPATYPVSGTVTMDGQPVANATLSFQLSDASRGAAGVTDDQGRYDLTTFEPGDGAVPGEYLVAIMKYDAASQGAAVSEDDPNYDPNVTESVAKNLLPERYASVGTSGLKVTIIEEKNTEVNFELTK